MTVAAHAAPDSGAPSQSLRPARDWAVLLKEFREPQAGRSVRELLLSAVPFALLWLLMWASLGVGYWLCLLLALPTAGFLVRLFMIQHDCGHGTLFRRRAVNDWIGRVIGVVTLTPYSFWRRSHAVHHASSGNLDRRGVGDIDTLTTTEYAALPWRRRLAYRLFRHPAVLFGVGPAFLFVLKHRLPFGMMRAGREPWISTMTTNLAIAAVVTSLMLAVGVGPFLLVHVPVLLLASSIGVWLFYVQHQFEDTYWAADRGWSVHDGALHGSSHYELPDVLRWFTANIGMHHLHHLCSRIPFYRLPDVLRTYPELRDVSRLTLLDSLRCVRLTLWDEQARRLVSFREARLRRQDDVGAAEVLALEQQRLA